MGDPLEEVLSEVARTHEALIEDPYPEADPEPIPKARPVPKTGVSRAVVISLVVAALVVIAALSVVIWTKTKEINGLRAEKQELLRRIEEWRTKESLRLKQAGETDKVFDFRQTWWGMPREKVIASHGRSPDGTREDAILYNDALLGKSVSITYGFSEDRLARAQYKLTETYPDPNDELVVYDGLKVVLTRKYGPPVEVKDQWTDKTWFDDKGKWGRAVAEGNVTFLSTWETERTTITAFLGAENGRINCLITYTGRVLTPPESKNPI